MIDFYDNQPCIDLIEERLGVLSLLDEECRVPQGSDAGFVAKLHQNCAKYPHFLKPRFGNAGMVYPIAGRLSSSIIKICLVRN